MYRNDLNIQINSLARSFCNTLEVAGEIVGIIAVIIVSRVGDLPNEVLKFASGNQLFHYKRV